MSKTLEELRATLAAKVGRFLTGVATSGNTSTLVDENGLVRFEDDDTFVGGAILYIREAGGTAPEDEWRWVTGHDADVQEIDVEYPFSAAVASGDTYELYRARLPLERWNDAINNAIKSAWPVVWLPEFLAHTAGTGGIDELDLGPLSTATADVVDVWVQDANVSPNWQLLPREMWRVAEGPMQFLYLERTVASGRSLRILVKEQYDELEATKYTELDEEFIIMGARAELYGMLAAEHRGQASSRRYMQLMGHWQGMATQRRQELGLLLERVSPVAAGQKKK